MVSKLCIVDFLDSRQALGPQITVPHNLGLILPQLLRLPLEVGTLERLTIKWNQSTWDCYEGSGRGQYLLNNCCVVGIFWTHTFTCSVFSMTLCFFLLLLTFNMRKLRLKEVKELDLFIHWVNGWNISNSGPFDSVAVGCFFPISYYIVQVHC